MQEYGLTSFITSHNDGETVTDRFTIKGYAISGSRSQISKVEIALVAEVDGKETVDVADERNDWTLAKLTGTEHPFAWVLFEADVSIPKKAIQSTFGLVCRAGMSILETRLFINLISHSCQKH